MKRSLSILATGAVFAVASALSSVALAADECSILVGRVLPQTGSLAVSAQAHPWIDQLKVDQVNKDGGLKVDGKRCKVAFKLYDSKSTAAGAGDAASKAIVDDGVNVVVASFTPETTNAPTAMCERYEVPCITSITPVEGWLLGPDGKPQERKWGHHFFFTVPDLVRNHLGTLKALPGGFNGKIGYLYPNDPDGIVFHSLFDGAFKKEGWQPVDPGRFDQNGDFAAIAKSFKAAQVEAVAGVLEPPALIGFLKAAEAEGFKPKVYLIDKSTGFAEAMAAVGKGADGVAGVEFWSATWPGKSKYGGWSAAALIAKYEGANAGKYASPPLGYADATYDVLFDAIERAGSVEPAKLAAALHAADLDTVVGRVKFNAQNVSAQPAATVQWRLGADGRWVRDTVYNGAFPAVGVSGPLRLYQVSP